MNASTVAAVAALGLALAITAAPFLPRAPIRPNPRRKPAGGPCHRQATRQDYLFPDEWRYPVPTRACARRALTYAAWPENLYDAPRVVERLFRVRPELRFDRAVRAQADRLLARYDRATARKKAA
jgi:hypothetical protein